jgi:hypothetical protein
MVFVDKFGLREPSRNCGRGLAFSPDQEQEQEQDRLGPDTVSKSYTIIFAILIETRIFISTRASHKSHSQFSFSKPISLNSNDFPRRGYGGRLLLAATPEQRVLVQ